MISFYNHPTPNPLKVAIFLDESGLAYEVLPVDTRLDEQHQPGVPLARPQGVS